MIAINFCQCHKLAFYWFKVDNGNTRTICENPLKVSNKINDVVLMSLFLNLNRLDTIL